MSHAWLIVWIGIGGLLGYGLGPGYRAQLDRVRRVTFLVLTPCLLFSVLSRAQLDGLPDPLLMICYYGIFLALFLGIGWRQRPFAGMDALAALHPNAVGIGIPLVFALFDEAAQLTLMAFISVNQLLVLPLFSLWASVWVNAGVHSLRDGLRDPVLLAILGGFAVNRLGISLPVPVDALLSLIGELALPLILLCIGLGLGNLRGQTGHWQRVPTLVLVKLGLFPALVLAGGFLLEVAPEMLQIAVLIAALPTGINVYVLAERFQLAVPSTARVIMLTTLLSLLSVNFWLYLTRALL